MATMATQGSNQATKLEKEDLFLEVAQDNCNDFMSEVLHFYTVLLPRAVLYHKWTHSSVRRAMIRAQKVQKIFQAMTSPDNSNCEVVQNQNEMSFLHPEMLTSSDLQSYKLHSELHEALSKAGYGLADMEDAEFLLMSKLLLNNHLTAEALTDVQDVAKCLLSQEVQVRLEMHVTQVKAANEKLKGLTDPRLQSLFSDYDFLSSIQAAMQSGRLDRFLSSSINKSQKSLVKKHKSERKCQTQCIFLQKLLVVLNKVDQNSRVCVEILAWITKVHVDSSHTSHVALLCEWLDLFNSDHLHNMTPPCYCGAISKILVSLLRAFYDLIESKTSPHCEGKIWKHDIGEENNSHLPNLCERTPRLCSSKLSAFFKHLISCPGEQNEVSDLPDQRSTNFSQNLSSLPHQNIEKSSSCCHAAIRNTLHRSIAPLTSSPQAFIWLTIYSNAGVI